MRRRTLFPGTGLSQSSQIQKGFMESETRLCFAQAHDLSSGVAVVLNLLRSL